MKKFLFALCVILLATLCFYIPATIVAWFVWGEMFNPFESLGGRFVFAVMFIIFALVYVADE